MAFSKSVFKRVKGFCIVGANTAYLGMNIKREKDQVYVNGKKVSMKLVSTDHGSKELVFQCEKEKNKKFRLTNFFACDPSKSVIVEEIFSLFSLDHTIVVD
jgi:hypothetical protein